MTEEKQAHDQEALIGGPNTIPEFINKPWECPSIAVDGLSGIVMSSHTAKIYLADHHPVPEGLMGRHVASLVIPLDQFLKIADSIAVAAARIREAEGGGG